MANKIKFKRSYTAGAVPTTSDLDTHEIAINWADNKLFTKNAAGSIVSVSLGGGSASADSRWDLFLPPSPTGVTATSGNAQAAVSWTAPTVLSQTPLTDYTLQYQPSGGSWTTFSRSASTSTSATVTGLSNGTAYQFRVAAVNSVGTGSYSTASSAVTPTSGDPYWSSVQLLIPGDTSTADASSFSRSVTANGSAAATSTQKKFGAGSIALNGSSWLTVPQANVTLSSSDFVIECWVYLSSYTSGYKTLWSQRSTESGVGGALAVVNGSSLVYFISDASGSVWGPTGAYSGLSITAAQWNHIAMVRNGSTVTMYLNGVAGTSVSVSGAIGSSGDFAIGAGAANGAQAITGYIDDFRLTIGTNRGYTGATITVPTAAFPNS